MKTDVRLACKAVFVRFSTSGGRPMLLGPDAFRGKEDTLRALNGAGKPGEKQTSSLLVRLLLSWVPHRAGARCFLAPMLFGGKKMPCGLLIGRGKQDENECQVQKSVESIFKMCYILDIRKATAHKVVSLPICIKPTWTRPSTR